jgi:hypothetical protein
MQRAPAVHSSRAMARLTGVAVLAAVLAAALTSPAGALAATRYISPSGADSGACTSASAPCRSFGHAYRQSAPGDVVEMAGGQYGSQTIPAVSGRGGPAVTFQAAPGAQPVLGELNVSGSYVSVRDVVTSSVDLNGARGVEIVRAQGRQMNMQDVHDVAIIGGAYGGNQDVPTVQIAGSPASSNIAFDGVDFHDAVATNSSVHMECIWAGGVQGFTVRNSIFRNCAYFDIFFTRLNGPDPKDVLLENNVFEVSKQWNGQNAPYAVNVANWLSKAENFTFRNNSFGGDIAIQPAVSNMKLVGNVGAVASCKSGVSYSYNVFTKAKCSATDKQVGGALSQFVDIGAHDWRLKPGAAAINAGNPLDFPLSDREGLLRNGLPDAGAHEFGGIRAFNPPAPGGGPGGGPGTRRRGLLRKASLSRHVICKRPRRRCPGSARLRVVLAAKARLTITLKHRHSTRFRNAERFFTVKRLRLKGKSGANKMRIRARGLPRGRYRLIVTARNAAGKVSGSRTLRLRVR